MTSQSDISLPAAAEVAVDLGERSYRILIGEGLLEQAGRLIAGDAPAARAAIIADKTVHKLHGARLEAALNAAGIGCETITVPPGEASKSFAETERVCRAVLASGTERGDLVIAFGGGVTGDLAGFVSGLVRRGIRYVQIPTSLLAQVDSSVGGKTGINTPEGKNLIGLFNQPRLVIADTALLDTLPARELRAGYAEIVKYGLIGNADFFSWLEKNGAAVLAGDGAARREAVKVSCEAKATVVAADEREAGARALLNLGHTFGHALEAATGYSDRLIHGEGVAIGMALAFELSAKLGLCGNNEPARVATHLAEAGLPTTFKDVPGTLPDADGLVALMMQDKKVSGGKLTFVLARGIGDAVVTQDVPAGTLKDFLKERLART